MALKKVLSIFGTRPEAIKMAPLVKWIEADPDLQSIVCVTGQHETMLQQVLDQFDITPDHRLAVMTENQTLNGLAARVLDSLNSVFDIAKPDRVLVHGDTTTASFAALAAFHRRIPVAHVEAGLRTGDLSQPWPEEMNRRVADIVCDLLFAPTVGAKANLQAENLQGRVVVTGNTVIDALMMTAARIDADAHLRKRLDAALPFAGDGKPILLVTGHRRESFGDGFHQICLALRDIARRDAVQIVYPVHLNPNVREPVLAMLQGEPNVHLIEPLDYLGFVRLMQRAAVVLTDSGGVQEEAPALGKPVLVMRTITERPEAVEAGTVRLVGTSRAAIGAAVSALLGSSTSLSKRPARIPPRAANPYGDGRASERIVAALAGRQFTEFGASPPVIDAPALPRAQRVSGG
ncbi:UDP-N-acetylglucosamine 2-epimerase (non-hydrolyzing) [Caballeronia sp. dw_276]|jgi:UDP-N-acetylglucosamine 2-epimerase (non-hydrolysing)|uniref:non-hydrolyzing UDP-N-acetylglucosamine 2-epimerase n=1 Tax=Caballeronia sp. dw_276 TaxID=2719795 RepID=UPI0023EF30A3|nr:UDP-N-acetylglucosamine 2-epimerase (non-hydrolyzing) [Caballeronia sp. dw_276]